MDKDLKKEYSDLAPEYDEIVLEKAGYISHERISSLVLENAPENPKVLDVGCGTGLSSLQFFERGWDVTGIDIAEGMIEQAGNFPFSDLVVGNIEEDLPFDTETFDIAVAVGVTEFIDDIHGLLSEIRRVLKPDGLLGLTLPVKDENTQSLQIHSYEPESAQEMLEDAGYTVLEEDRFKAYVKKGKPIHHLAYLLK